MTDYHHDRYGEAVDLDGHPHHDPRCRGGWLGVDTEHRPIPCLTCRPHLARTRVEPAPSLSLRAQAAIEKADRDQH